MASLEWIKSQPKEVEISVGDTTLGEYADFVTTNLHRACSIEFEGRRYKITRGDKAVAPVGREWLVYLPRLDTFAVVMVYDDYKTLVTDCHYELSVEWHFHEGMMRVMPKFDYLGLVPRVKPTVQAALEFRRYEL